MTCDSGPRRTRGRVYDNDASFATRPIPVPTPAHRADPSAPTEADDLAAPVARMLRPSKTRRKEESHELQALGEALLEFSDAQLATLGLGEPLVEAIAAARRMRSHEAKRRQMQLIGKLMRSADVELARVALAERQLGRARDSLALHRAERWRAELIADDDAATRFASEHPGIDMQRLRALVRNARKDAALVPEKRSGRAFRELFQFVRDHESPADA
jgi:ribosome-associated protein